MLYAYSDRVPPRLDLTKHRYIGPCWLEALNDARKQMQAFTGSLAMLLLHRELIENERKWKKEMIRLLSSLSFIFYQFSLNLKLCFSHESIKIIEHVF